MNTLNQIIQKCNKCEICKESYNLENRSLGTGKLLGFYQITYKNKIMLVGLNPSHRRFPGIYQAFGGDVKHSGTGWTFIKLLEKLNLLDKIYLTNLIKCSVSNNKPPKEIFDNCFDIFKREIELVDPPLIIALGNSTYLYLKDKIKRPLKKIHHPNFWISYRKMTIKEYSEEILKSLEI